MSGLFSSETIITVQANTVQLIDTVDIPNTVVNSTFESVITPRDIPLNVLDDLVLGSNAKTQNYYRYGRGFYHYGLPSGQLRITGVDNKVIRNHIEAFEGQPVEILRVDIDHETGQMQLASWFISTYNLNPVTLLITTYPASVTNSFNTMSTESVNNYNTVINGFRNNLNAEFNSTTVNTETIGNTTTTTTVTRVSTITESLTTDEIRSAYLGDLNQTSNPEYSSVRRVGFTIVSATRTADYSYDVWFILESSFYTQFVINCEETTVTETSTDNGDGTFTNTSFTDVNNFTETRKHTFVYEDTGLWIGTKSETWEVEFTPITDIDGNVTRIESINTRFAIYYSINNGAQNKFITRNFTEYKDQFIGTNTSNIGGKYYPIVPIRRNNQDLTRTAVQSGNAYITSKRLMKRLGVSLAEVSEAINENPNVADIDHAYFMLGIPVNETDKAAARYFFEFFNIIHGIRQSTATPTSALGGLLSTRYRRGYTGNIFSIADAGLRIEIGFGSITKESKLGTIGPKGFSTVTHSASKNTINGQYGIVNTIYSGLLTVRKQTEINTYEEIRVTNLNYKNYVYQNHTVDVHYYDAIHGNDENFVLPLFEPAVKKMSLIQRDRLLYMAPHLVLNSYEKTKVKWYQSGFFSFLLQVVGFAIAIYTGGLGGFAAGMTFNAFAMMLIKKILISIAFNFAFKLVAKALGEEFAMLLALALAAYGLMGKGTGATFGIPNSELMMKASTSLIQGVQTNIQKDFENLVDTANRFSENMERQLEELEAINKEMDPSNSIDPWIFLESMQPYTRWGESPDDYYNRTVHAGNPGTMSIDAVSKYVDIMLRLPELPDTITESNDEEETEYESTN